MLNVSSSLCQRPTSPPRTTRKRKLEDFFTPTRKSVSPKLHRSYRLSAEFKNDSSERASKTLSLSQDERLKEKPYWNPSDTENFMETEPTIHGNISKRVPRSCTPTDSMQTDEDDMDFEESSHTRNDNSSVISNSDGNLVETSSSTESTDRSMVLVRTRDISVKDLSTETDVVSTTTPEIVVNEKAVASSSSSDSLGDESNNEQQNDNDNEMQDDSNNDEKDDEEYGNDEYEVWRVMKRTVNAQGEEAFIVYWKNYNYTFCTMQSRGDLDGCPDELKNLEDKEVALKAIMRNLRSHGSRYDKPIEMLFTPMDIPDFLPPGQSNIPDDQFMALANTSKHGYWRIKQLEVQWNDVIRNYYDKRRRKIAPLYVEGWHPSAFASLPKFTFIVGSSRWSDSAKKMRYKAVKDLCSCCVCVQPCHNCSARAEEEYSVFCPIENGLLKIPKHVKGSYFWTYECDGYKQCTCKKCEYRLLTRGRKVALVVFYEPKKGWTVRASQDIKMGQFIAEYVGEVVTAKEANRRDTSYQFEIGKFWYVDALPYGNESRFFSHSCKPNSLVVRVYGLNQAIHKVAVFALRDIKIGEEITFDYHPDYSPGDLPRGSGGCECKESTCRGWL
ncbi:unnamed protein product [Auanema sp. JU1783]|nr:unnamed protein product [Auanema sp. JU1783]